MIRKTSLAAIAAAASILAPLVALGQAATTFTDNFSGVSATNSWNALGGACLTAGNNTGTIPACVGNSYYTSSQAWIGGATGTLPDTSGQGALRLTNGCTGTGCGTGDFNHGYRQAGAIISNTTYSTGDGLQITFKTFTYEGNTGGNGGGSGIDGHDGADGISFFLLDGTVAPPYVTGSGNQFDVGAFGGSLGYSCSNNNDDSNPHPDGTTRHYDGIDGGYLGLGIDEYGNFLNPGDNTSTGPGLQAGRIGLRGAGSVNWYWLNNTYPTLYPNTWSTSNQALAVKYTCRSGYLEDYKGSKLKLSGATVNLASLNEDYDAIPNAYTILSSTTPIAKETATTRAQATPITYSLKITQNGILSLAYSYNGGAYQTVLPPQYITNNNLALPSSVRFGFAGSTGGSTNVHEILCFQVNPQEDAGTSAGINQKQATKIETGTQAFLASYSPNNWPGDLAAYGLQYDSTTKLVQIASLANWDASCVLTGGTAGCAATGQTGTITAESPSSRVMLTWNGAQGIPFEWSSLSTAAQNILDAGDPTPYTSKRLSYLRGDRTNEITLSGTGLYRARNSVLGDIVDASPTWVGPPSSPYTTVWKDKLHPSDAAPENGASQSYATFVGLQQARQNVVYVGANDGFLHGFRAGAYNSSGQFVNNATTPNDGQEVLAYMPGAVYQTIHNGTTATVDYSNAQYAHDFYVDATPDQDDLFYGGAWHTWLVGGLGAGGQAMYALDITDPTQFSETNAKALVIGEWTPSTISCANTATSCGANLGNTYGTPVIRRLHNGAWAVIFGNGYGSASGDAGIFIMIVDPTSGAKTFYYLGTGQTNDGIAYPSPADLDGDGIIDYVYAGDLKGNVWRFDLTSDTTANWTVSSTPLFTDPNGHPITTKVAVGATLTSQGSSRVMVDFGTGQKVPLTVTTGTTYASGTHYLYGIWDSNMASWNAMSSVQYASLTSPPASITTANLQKQTISAAAQAGVFDDTSNTVCWADNTSCGSTLQYGWYLQLPGTNEQVIYNPLDLSGHAVREYGHPAEQFCDQLHRQCGDRRHVRVFGHDRRRRAGDLPFVHGRGGGRTADGPDRLALRRPGRRRRLHHDAVQRRTDTERPRWATARDRSRARPATIRCVKRTSHTMARPAGA